MKRLVHLWDHVGTALIIKCATGIVYSNQTGGTSCLTPEQEGALVPIGNDVALPGRELISAENELGTYFEGPAYHRTGATNGLGEDDADFIDRVLGARPSLEHIRVDRTKLARSHEAWVHVILAEETGAPCQAIGEGGLVHDHKLTITAGFGPFPLEAILTWSNSD